MQYSHFRKFIFLFIPLLFSISVKSQSFVGAGLGTFNIPGADSKFRGYGPTLEYEFIGYRQRNSGFIDVSYFAKSQYGTKYSYIYSQLGAKSIFGEADEKKIIPYIGYGIAIVYASSEINDQNSSRTIFGFHFNTGVQYNFKPVILELRGNLDIVLKPLVESSSDSNVMTNFRLSALVPISK